MKIRNHFKALVASVLLSAFMAVEPVTAAAAEPKPLISSPPLSPKPIWKTHSF